MTLRKFLQMLLISMINIELMYLETLVTQILLLMLVQEKSYVILSIISSLLTHSKIVLKIIFLLLHLQIEHRKPLKLTMINVMISSLHSVLNGMEEQQQYQIVLLTLLLNIVIKHVILLVTLIRKLIIVICHIISMKRFLNSLINLRNSY